jgi:cytoskeleton protein RodZ
MLRKAREDSGLHVAALAVSLKVPVHKLEALEAGRLDLLPDAVFARALASSVCRNLKIDPAPILQHLPHTAAPRLRTDESGINTPFREPGATAAQPWWAQFMRPAPLIVTVLVLGALVLMLLPRLKWEEPAVAKNESTSEVMPPGSPPANVAAGTVETVPSTDGAAGSSGAATPAAEPAAKPVPPASAAAATAAPAAPSAAPAASVAAVPVSGIVVFQPKGETWVQVTDANGVVALRKTLLAGETTGASGALPLAVVVGRADATDVEIRGKAFDLTPVSRDNVARFEVK